MFTIVDENCRILFGDAQTNNIHHKTPEFLNNMLNLKNKELSLSKLIFQKQVHGIDGRYIDNNNELSEEVELFKTDGDFLITDQSNMGIGVLTADCLPIVFYAPKHHTLAVAHAGWRSSVLSIATKVVDRMREHHKILPQDLRIFFGPAAKSCCYTVQRDFIQNLESFDYKDKLISSKNGKLFFDNVLLNKLQLIDLGIAPTQIDTNNNHCTICDLRFHSYRRTQQKESYKVQPTIAWLNK